MYFILMLEIEWQAGRGGNRGRDIFKVPQKWKQKPSKTETKDLKPP